MKVSELIQTPFSPDSFSAFSFRSCRICSCARMATAKVFRRSRNDETATRRLGSSNRPSSCWSFSLRESDCSGARHDRMRRSYLRSQMRRRRDRQRATTNQGRFWVFWSVKTSQTQNQTKCRFNENKGHFWKKALGTCHTCSDLVAPEFLSQSCFFDNRGRKRCQLFCEWNQDLILNGDGFKKNMFKTTCRCPRPNKRECSWKGQDKINNLTCIATPTTEPPTTFTGTGLPFTGMNN